MKKIFCLAFMLILSGCVSSSNLVVSQNVYQPKPVSSVDVRFRAKGDQGNYDIGQICPGAKQISFSRTSRFVPFIFLSPKSTIDGARKNAAEIGGDGVSIFNYGTFSLLIMSWETADGIVYKCPQSGMQYNGNSGYNGSRYNHDGHY